MVTAFPNLEIAVEAMRCGAFDYVDKGTPLEDYLIRIKRAVEVAQLRQSPLTEIEETRAEIVQLMD